MPELSLVVLVGASGSGKSTLARRLFQATEILSSDTCRGWVSDDENSLDATSDAFDVLHYVARKRLARGLLTVIDATSVRAEDRKALVQLARDFHCLPVAIVVDTPEHICHERNAARSDRNFGPHVVRNQRRAMKQGLRSLDREGFRGVHFLRTPEECDSVMLVREPLWNNRKHDEGPFDIVGDVHGCYDELVELLRTLGYQVSQREGEPEGECEVAPPAGTGRKVVFVGDLVDRGPKTPSVLRMAMRMVRDGRALCVPGNHDVKLVRALNGRKVNLAHGLAESLEQLSRESGEFRSQVARFLDGLVSHYVLDGGRLVVAHAGLREEMQGRGSGAVRNFAMFGETTGESDEYGLPVRYDWASEYRGRAAVVYGHTPVLEPEWVNGTLCIDTGCVFGGSLTALRWPEREWIMVKARTQYAMPRKPIAADAAPVGVSLQQQLDDLLSMDDVNGRRHIETRLARSVTIREQNAAAALEIMSRFACDPKWLIYLPPTMSPCETAVADGLLEHPRQAFDYYRSHGVGQVVCEEKHMGSRAVVVVCRSPEVAQARFGILSPGTPRNGAAGCEALGAIYTRTGRPFFGDPAMEAALLRRVRDAAQGAGLWEELQTDWMCLDCELMPWSAKAQGLIRDQYAPVGVAAELGLSAAVGALERAAARLPDAREMLEVHRERLDLARRYADSYRRYCWPAPTLDEYRLAPFHLLASENKVHVGETHVWHMQALSRFAASGDPVLVATNHRLVDLSSEKIEKDAVEWWTTLTESGGEGMVVKPLNFIARGSRGLLQPAIKVRGKEYLRIIYGPEYTRPMHLERLRKRGLAAKRSLALREFALGIESLERFVRREPLRRVHECVFAVLALESEPVDPRL